MCKMPKVRSLLPKTEFIPGYLILIALFLVPLVFTDKTIEAGSIKTLVTQLAVIGCLFFWILDGLIQRRLQLPEWKVLALLLGLLVINFISYLSSSYKYESGATLWWLSVLVGLCLLA